MTRSNRGAVCAALLLASGVPVFVAQEYKANLPADDPAIRYHASVPDDAASRLAQRLGREALPTAARGGPLGTLSAVLDALHLSSDSQMLVFSKTSLQAPRISPDRPRAIYFNDDVALAYVPGSSSLEIAAIDRHAGPIFYTMTLGGRGAPAITRGQGCLRCHQGPNTAGVPGLYVGSVIPGPTGAPVRDDTAIITDHRTPFEDRWGGWYVTAKRGEQLDRANATASNPAEPAALVRERPPNLQSLVGFFDRSQYLAGSSDIIALMTFEHQTQMTNLITRVGWEARMSTSGGTEGISAALNADIDDLAAYMLFAREAPLREPVEGVSSFARTFPEGGPRDHLGRSLREFDLQTRLFRYPLSFMIYSEAFDALPSAARAHVYGRLHDVLSGADRSPEYARLTPGDRRAILEILRDTKKDLPEVWHGTP
jgi:hypothetical protein